MRIEYYYVTIKHIYYNVNNMTNTSLQLYDYIIDYKKIEVQN